MYQHVARFFFIFCKKAYGLKTKKTYKKEIAKITKKNSSSNIWF